MDIQIPTETLTLLQELHCNYAFYLRRKEEKALLLANAERFPSASIIKVPILLAWLHLEHAGEVDRRELCSLDLELPRLPGASIEEEFDHQGAGIAWLFAQRSLPFHDILLMMIGTSDNLCTNLVIRRIGVERLDAIFHEHLGLSENTSLQRKLMDYAARQRGLDNWIGVHDMIHLYDVLASLRPEERTWVDTLLLANQDDTLLKRDFRRDTCFFYHKTGSIPHVLHDWGYTRDSQIFLLTHGFEDEGKVNSVFARLGQLMAG